METKWYFDEWISLNRFLHVWSSFESLWKIFEGEKIEKFSFKNKEEIQNAVDVINKTKFKIADVNTKVFRRNPLAPFTTSTLQQTASGRFGFGASRTMQIAQRLYQGVDIEGETTGLITYMRTDGTNISKSNRVI